VIRFLWSEGVSGAEKHRRLSTQYGNSALPRRSAYEICQRLVDCYDNEGKEESLSRIVTGDETLVHHYEPESKWEIMEWKHPGSPTKKKLNSLLRGGNMQACGPLGQVYRKGRRLCRKITYFFNPYFCVNKLEKQKCG
jgi:hypothetical protein